MLKHSLKQIVSNGNLAKVSHICQGIVYYTIEVGSSSYQLAIDSMDDEWKATYLQPEFKAITLMRWIRKSIDNGTLIQLK
jgi:hypothetical protein